MKLPGVLPLMGHIIPVTLYSADEWPHGDDYIGIWDPNRLAIDLNAEVDGTKLEQVFFHELTHAVLDVMNHRLSRNEAFVDQFASLLHQAITGATYLAAKRPKKVK